MEQSEKRNIGDLVRNPLRIRYLQRLCVKNHAEPIFIL